MFCGVSGLPLGLSGVISSTLQYQSESIYYRFAHDLPLLVPLSESQIRGSPDTARDLPILHCSG
jgi:hypothetical protein